MLKENDELLERGEDALSPKERMTLESNQEIIDGYYESLKELDHDWRTAFHVFYQEIANQKIITSGGGILGVDKSTLTSIFDEYDLDVEMRRDMRRRIHVIDRLITEFENEYAESQRRNQSIGKGGSTRVPGNQSVFVPAHKPNK